MTGPNLVEDEICPFCNATLRGAVTIHSNRSCAIAQCPVCGTYEITGESIDLIAHWPLSDEKRLAFAFAVRRMTDRPEVPEITADVLRGLRDTVVLPLPDALLDEAVFWFGRHSACAGETFEASYTKHRAVLGLIDPQVFDFIADWMLSSGLFQGIRPTAGLSGDVMPILECRLSPEGWRRYAELTRSHAASRFGFIAMRYGDPGLDAIVANHFMPEVRKAGFDLRRLDQGQPAGLIDDQLRIMIRTARFMVCDLTHGNRGAYWESGFAEGLGKPVIYTCREDVFCDKQNDYHPHFDTNHMVTVIWNQNDPVRAARRLKDTIRATLPSEAKLED